MTAKKRKRRPHTKGEARRKFMDRVLLAMDSYYHHSEASQDDVEAGVSAALNAKFPCPQTPCAVKKVQS